MMRRASFFTCAALAVALPAGAQQLTLPSNAEMVRELQSAPGSHPVPTGPWAAGQAQTVTAQGKMTRRAWRLSGSSITTLQLMNTLAAQIEAAEFEALYRCEDTACGGFDFRFGLPVMPPPEMFVDLFDYRFLSARRGTGADARYVTLLVSRSGATTYVQVTRITPTGAVETGGEGVAPEKPASSGPQVGAEVGDAALVAALRANGHVILSDLDFGTGAAGLGAGPYASLQALAAFLMEDASRRVALVGHTDTVGGYEANLVLSRRRARAVMEHLVETLDVPADQLEADGIAYLSPQAPNTDAAGREANRRVEAVLLSGQ
ncbi:OmpA family protein [Roseovarius sp. S4756]|uniref:OmpA family protein n=1 Tax=Roseovarius maritimus TaxID=3342637 RepID=UPI0037271554